MTARERIEGLALARQKIAAIKEYRTATGVGLSDAKDAVEYFEAHRSWRPRDLEAIESTPPEAAVATAYPSTTTHQPGHAASGETPEEPTREPAQPTTEAQASSLLRPEFPLPSSHLSLPVQGAHSVNADAKSLAAAKALNAKLGDVPTLASAPSECSFYSGYLFVTDERVAFVADRYGTWEVMENLERAALRRVEVKSDLFGAELVLEAGLHTAHFTAMDADAAEGLRRYLSGESSAVPSVSRRAAAPSERTDSSDAFEAANAALSLAAGPQLHPEFPSAATSAGPIHSAVHLMPAGAAVPSGNFRTARVVGLTIVACIPVGLVSVIWRLLPMEGFPNFLYVPLYWSALSFGGVATGRAGPMLQAGFAVGVVSWLLSEFVGLWQETRWLAVAILCVVYARTWKGPGGIFLGLVATLFVLVLDRALTVLSVMFDLMLPTTAMAFWLVHFSLEEWKGHRRAQQLSTAAVKQE